MLMRVFLGWLRSERGHCGMVAIPTLEDEDARRPSRERESLVGERTRIMNRMKAILAWLGVRGFNPKLPITKQGNRYIRRLLVLGAISVLRAAPKRKGALCDWLAALRARKPPKVGAVALANKLARIVWAIITPPARPSAAPSTPKPDPNRGQRTRKENAGSRVWRARQRRDERHGETIEDHRTLCNGSGALSSPP